VKALRPVVAGWASHVDPITFLVAGAGHLAYDKPIRSSADFVEAGGLPSILCAGLSAGVDASLTLGVPVIWRHVNDYLERLETGLLELGFESGRASDAELRSCCLCVKPPDFAGVPELNALLHERGVACSTPDGWLRFAPHWPNSLDEVGVVVEAVRDALRELER
jgi:hypothetical protein